MEFVGQMAAEYIGLLSKKDAQRYDTELEKIGTELDSTKELLKAQITIAKETATVFKTGWNQLRHEIDSAHTLIERVRSGTVKEQQIISAAVHVSFLLTEVGSQQDILSDILVEAYNGQIHPTLISQDRLREELINIRSHLPTGTKLPQELTDENLIQYFKYIRTRARVFDGKVIIELKIPLLYNTEFQLFKMASVPVPINDHQMAFIKPSSPFYMVTVDRSRYYT